ncbi:MAG: Bug family tripartite tricarboxylate transporter substrate binding protein [Pollutimonas bauzanensis]
MVPFAAGGPSDVLARLVGQKMSAELQQTVVVENKPGATGAIGTRYVAHAKPDGLTLLLASSSSMTTGPLLMPDIQFDPVKDFVPLDLIANDENVLVVHPSVPVHSVKELIAYAKADPGRLNYSTSGVGSSYHLGTELFSSLTGIEMAHVPYKGSSQAVMDLLAGRVQVQFQAISQAKPHIESGKVRPLAVASLSNNSEYSNLPTIAEEANIPGFEFSTWMGIFAPSGTPDEQVVRLRSAMQTAMATSDIKDRVRELGMTAISRKPEAIASQISSDLEKWGAVIKKAGISLN